MAAYQMGVPLMPKLDQVASAFDAAISSAPSAGMAFAYGKNVKDLITDDKVYSKASTKDLKRCLYEGGANCQFAPDDYLTGAAKGTGVRDGSNVFTNFPPMKDIEAWLKSYHD